MVLHGELLGPLNQLPVGGSEDPGDEVELLLVVAPPEQRPSEQQLREDGTYAPYVHGLRVLAPAHDDLRRAVPTGGDVVRHGDGLPLHVRVVDPAQAKVADLQVAVRVHQEVAGLQVPVDHVRRVEEEDAPEDLVQEELDVRLGEVLGGLYYGGEVGFHQFGDDVEGVEVCAGKGKRNRERNRERKGRRGKGKGRPLVGPVRYGTVRLGLEKIDVPRE